ncbi:hypothetical protein DOY81_003363 [Sarcophaga bullata]|nr:hypothetical protein DOY81_003363 [Sarcophaga bullata]
MELDDQETPQKLKMHQFFINYRQKKQQSQRQQSTSPSQTVHSTTGTPKNSSKYLRKTINPRTPKGQSVSYSVAACTSLVSSNNSMHSISMAVVQTPPAKRYQRVKNPFEAALAERLHLPLIASPSLFHVPNTPQMSSTQFEWTIEEVSSLKPAHVEPHETQFHDSPDPELEAKAQSAISSYFKEQQIVPSPIDCPLRSQRIMLSEINGDTPLSKPGRRIRDGCTQTELTLPPVLPLALEEALKPYFQPHLAGKGKELKRSYSAEVKDTSLRRKLFDMQNIVVIENENQKLNQEPLKTKLTNNHSAHQHSNSSPISMNSMQHTAIVGKLSDSLDKSSFGSLSPISASDSLSPNCCSESGSKRKTRFGSFISQLEEVEMLSPIHPPPFRRQALNANTQQHTQYRSPLKDITTNDNTSYINDDNENFSPERSSSPLSNTNHNNMAEFSTDSFNVKVSRLKVNSSRTQNTSKERYATQKTLNQDVDVFHDDTQDVLESTVDMDDMQVSQLSTHSSNCSSSQSDTPRCKRRSASRKNLSQSFSANWLEDEEEADDLETSQSLKIKELLCKKPLNHNVAVCPTMAITSASFAGVGNETAVADSPKKSVTFYRADSGFNEMPQYSSSSQDNQLNIPQQQEHQQKQRGEPCRHTLQDIMVCCSTPSTKNHFNFRA